jgi:protein-tyrosine-phosphatase
LSDLPQSVLFVCTNNVIRSPMAEAMVKAWHARRIYTRSIGLRAGEPDGFAIEVMNELGIDMSGHRPTSIETLDDTSFDLIVTLSPEAHSRILRLMSSYAAEVEYWPSEDPSVVEGTREQRLDAYRGLRDRLKSRIRQRLPIPGSLQI